MAMIISIINHTNGKVSDEELQGAIRAINRQIREEFEPYWHIGGELRLEGRSGKKPSTQNIVDMQSSWCADMPWGGRRGTRRICEGYRVDRCISNWGSTCSTSGKVLRRSKSRKLAAASPVVACIHAVCGA